MAEMRVLVSREKAGRLQQEAREMIEGALTFRLSYSELSVDEPTIQNKGKVSN